jgi:hypothetical protein
MLKMILALTLFGAFEDDLPKGWSKFSSPTSGFSITLPGEFKRQETTQKGPDQKDVKITVFRSNVQGESYLVTISEFSPEYMKNPPRTIFDNARNGSIERSNGKLIRETDIKLDSYPGRDIVVEAGNKAGYVRARVFVANQRQYSVMIATKTEAATDTADAKRFFESFQIQEIKAPPMKAKK